MQTSTKFSVAVHSLMMIAALSDKRKINSDVISESTGINAVIIRNIFKSLKQANMITVSPGPGGTTLARSADRITLWDILTAVEGMGTEDIFKFHPHPSKHCPVGSNVNGLLKKHLDTAVEAMRMELSSVTLAILVEELYDIQPELAQPPADEPNSLL